jgi:hypothetical protein
VVPDPRGNARLSLGFFQTGAIAGQVTIPFKTLPAFRAAVNAAIKQALQQQREPASHAGGTVTTTDPDDQE